jgi:hypothetical protein
MPNPIQFCACLITQCSLQRWSHTEFWQEDEEKNVEAVMVELYNIVIKYSCSYIWALLNYLTTHKTPVLTHTHMPSQLAIQLFFSVPNESLLIKVRYSQAYKRQYNYYVVVLYIADNFRTSIKWYLLRMTIHLSDHHYRRNSIFRMHHLRTGKNVE